MSEKEIVYIDKKDSKKLTELIKNINFKVLIQRNTVILNEKPYERLTITNLSRSQNDTDIFIQFLSEQLELL